MTSSIQSDVIIVGCGPVGVVAAHLLGEAGISTLVIERDREPYDLPRAVHLDHEIMRIFQSVGLAELLLPQLIMPAGAMHFGADRGVIRQFQAMVTTDRLGWGSDYFFYQPDLERALRAALMDRGTVQRLLGHEVVRVEQDEYSVTVVAHGDHGPVAASARYALACDGGRSTVRQCVGIALNDLGFDEPWIVVDAMVDTPIVMPNLIGAPAGVDMQRVMFIVGDPARPTSVIPGVGRHRRWEFMLLPGETAEDFADPQAVVPLLAPWLGGQPYELVRCAVYRFHALLAECWRSNRVFLVGDAAHQTPPFFGQGMCHGIRDASNLCWKLKLVLDGTAAPELLASYQAERLPQVRTVVEASMRVGRYICTLDSEAAKRRDVEMRAVAMRTAPGYVDIIPPLSAGVLAPNSSEMSLTGSRFIQPPVLDSSGARLLLDDATGGGFVMLFKSLPDLTDDMLNETFDPVMGLKRFTIVKAGEECPCADGCTLVDTSGELFKWFDYYRCSGVLLRPDAYVFGAFSTAEQGVTLLHSLRQQICRDKGSRHAHPQIA
jgi:3-(3-hydroxy-phenyl)propionate hydroxylase